MWQPVSEIPKFGILPLIIGTLKVTIVSMSVGVPLGVALVFDRLAPEAAERELVAEQARAWGATAVGGLTMGADPVACAAPNRAPEAPKLSGVVPEIRLRPGSYLQSFYGQDKVAEEFFCNFEISPDYEWASIEAGFPVVARGPQGEIRAIESPTHRFYVATLFQPQLSSRPGDPHPLILAFVQASADWGRKKLDDSVLE